MQLMNDLEHGADIKLSETPALEWELSKLMKNLIEKHRQKEMEKQKP